MWLLNLIPSILKELVSPFFQWMNKKEDVRLETDRNDVAVIQARTSLLAKISNVWSVQLGWALFIVPTGLWYSAIIVDSVARKYFLWEWRVLALPDNIAYIPYAVITFLFALAWRGRP